MKVSTDHWGQIVTDPTLVAHWPLDEAKGDISYDKVSVCDENKNEETRETGTLVTERGW